MTYSIHYLAGVGAKRLGLSAADVEVPTSDDGYGEFLNGLRHACYDPGDIGAAIRKADAAIVKIEELRECLKELKEQNQ